jgi:hypothetical protein
MPNEVNTVKDALEAAARASSPAETVQWLFAAVSLQQQQIAMLEMAMAQDDMAMTDVVARGKRNVHQRNRELITGR